MQRTAAAICSLLSLIVVFVCLTYIDIRLFIDRVDLFGLTFIVRSPVPALPVPALPALALPVFALPVFALPVFALPLQR